MTEFDKISKNYEELLSRGISLSGENSDYFAQNRVYHSAKLHSSKKAESKLIMDFGCGTGGSIEYLLESFTPEQLTAVDVSQKSLDVVMKKYCSSKVITKTTSTLTINEKYDLCFCNGVFHHISPKYRHNTAKIIYDSLKSGGYFYFWENNPWNPATHIVMSRIPFDRNAIKIFPHKAAKMLQTVGFKIKVIHYLFIFPKLLSFLRPLEKIFRRYPFGCQYLVLCQKI